MSELRSVLFQFLTQPSDPARRSELAASLASVDLAAARAEAKQDPGSGDAAAKVMGRMILDGASNEEVVEAAKLAAQKAPREGAGNDVALLAGVVVWRLSGQSAQAEPYFRRVRRNEPANPQILAFYREMFSADADASQLMQVLVQARRSLKKEDTDQRFALAHEMADLAEKKLGSIDRAIEVWRSVLREDGYDPRAAKALERLYREGQKWTALVELLKEEFDRVADRPENRDERITRLLEIAELYRDALRLDAMALATLQRILEINPRHAATIKALADTYGASGRWNDLLTVYGRLLDAARNEKDVPRQVDMLRRISNIWVDQLDNTSKGMEPLHEALRLAPDDRETRDALARIHELRKDWRALIDLRKDELASASGERACELRIALARIAEEKLNDRAEAIAGWREVLAQHGDVEEAFVALIDLYEREGRWSEAADILRRQIDAAAAPVRKVELLGRLAHLQADRLGQPEAAIETWAAVARLDPSHHEASTALREAYVSAGRWDDLVALYEAQGRLGEVLDVLYAAADQLADEEPKIALYQRIAGLARDRLNAPERGLAALERVLALRPTDLAVARELLPIYREQGAWTRMLAAYEVLLAGAADDDDRLELIAVMRDIALQKLNDPKQALQWAARAYELRPTDGVLRAGLEAAAGRADGWSELSAIYERRIAAADCDNAERLELLDKLATIARERLGEPLEAQRFFRQILDLDPANKVAHAALEEIYTATSRWADLAGVFLTRLSVTKENNVRLPLLRRVGALQEHKVGDLDAAIETYREILGLAAGDNEALDALTRLYRARGRWAELAEVLQRRLDSGDLGNDQISVLFELSQLHATRLLNSQKAIAGFLQILDFEPDHLPTIDALEVLRRFDPSSALAIMRGLLPYYRSVHDHGREAEAMEVITMAEPDAAVRANQLASLATLYGQMEGRRGDALRVRRELFVMNPEDAALRGEVERTGRELQRMDLVASAYGQILQNMRRAEEAADAEGRQVSKEHQALYKDLLLARAVALRDDLQQYDEAEAAFAELLDRDESHETAYHALDDLLTRRGAHGELLKLYRRRADIVLDAAEQKRLLEKIIAIARDVLNDREVATRTAEELLDLVPEDLGAMATVAGMYEFSERQDDHYALEELLGRWAERVEDDAERHDLAARRAGLRMDKLSDAYGAVDLLQGVIVADPNHEAARKLLERLLDHPEVQLQVANLLEPIYTAIKDHGAQVRVLRVRRAQAESLGSTDAATAHLLEIARIEENELGDAEAAFAAVREAYLLDPRRADARTELQRLGVELEKQRELVEVWQQALAKLPDNNSKIELLSRIAVVLDAHLDDRDGARKAYADLLALEPADVDLAKRATLALTRLHRAAGDAKALVEGLRGLLRYIDKDAEQVRILLEIAELHADKLEDLKGAASTYVEVLDIDPGNFQALDALERIYVDGGEWEALCRVLRQRVMSTDDPFEQARLWRKVGEIQRDHLSDPHQAIEAFQWIVDLAVAPKETQAALDAIVRLNIELERWPDAEEGLRRLIALATDDERKAELLGRAAEVVGEKLGRYADATDLLEEVLRLDPRDQRARATLTEYLSRDEIRDRVIAVLYPLYESEQNWRALLDLEERQARHQPAGRNRMLALLQVARTHEERLSDPGRSFEVLVDSLAEAGEQEEIVEVLDRIDRLGNELGRHEEVHDAYLKHVDNVSSSTVAHRMLGSIGRIARVLGRNDSARRAYERLFDASPADIAAAEALEQVLLEEGDFSALAELLVRRADRSDSDLVRDAFLIRAAELHRTKLDRLEDAIDLYQKTSAAAQRGDEVQAVLGPLYEKTERWGDLAEFLRRRLEGLSGRELVDTHLRLAQLYREQLGDLSEGLRQFAEALKADPDYVVGTEQLGRYMADEDLRPQVIAQLEPVFTAVGDWPRLIQIQELRLLEAGDDLHTRIPILLKIARIYEDQIEALEGAFTTAGRAFAEAPTDRSVRELLNRLAHALGRVEDLAQLYTKYAEDNADDEGDETLAIVREAAELWSVALGQPRRAVPLYQRLIEARPDDRTVFPALEVALTQAEMYPELATAYWHEADTSLDEERQLEVLQRLAELSLGILDDADQAIRAYRRVLEAQPDHEAARSRLERVYAERERWDDLIELLRERLVRTESPGEREVVLLNIADLQEGRLASVDAALDTVETLLTEQPANYGAVGALERMAEAHDAQRVRIFAVLRPIYEATGNTMRLIAVDEWQLTQTEDPAQRHQIYREIAAYYGGLDQGQAYAFRTLARALAEPGPAGVLESLDAEIQQIARTHGWLDELRQALLMAAEAETLQSDADRRVSLELQAAQIAIDIGDNFGAAGTLRHALEVMPDQPEVLALLDEALAGLADFEGLRGVLERRVAVSEDDEDRIVLLRRLARLVEEGLGQPEAAEGVWQRILDIEPNSTDAMNRLRRLYAARGAYDLLIAVIGRQIDAADDPAVRTALRKELAKIHREARSDREAEIDALRQLLLDAPEDDEALGMLAAALLAQDLHREAGDVILERAAIAPSRERRVGLLLEVARLHIGPIADSVGAMAHYESVFQVTPGHSEAIGDLMRLVRDKASSDAAAALVIPQLEQIGRWGDLAEVYKARSELTEDPAEAAEALRQLAKIRYERLNDPRGSLEASNLLLDRVAADEMRPVLEYTARLSVLLDRAEEHVESLARRAAVETLDPAARLLVAQSAAGMAEEILGDRARALGLLAAMLDAGIADEATARHIERLARAGGEKRLLARALRESAKLALGQAGRADILVRLGDAEFDTGELTGATEAYRDALDERPGFAGAVAGLERVLDRLQKTGAEVGPSLIEPLENSYHLAGNRPGLAKLARLRLQSATGADRAAALENLGRLVDEGGGSPDEALEAWGNLLQLDAAHPLAIERVVALAGNKQLLIKAVQFMAGAIDAAREDSRSCSQLCIETTKILLRDLRQYNAALRALAPVLAENPDSLEGLELQIMASRAAGELPTLHDSLVRYARLASNPDLSIPLLQEAANVAEAQAEPITAIADLRALLEFDQSHEWAWTRLLQLLEATQDVDGLIAALDQRITITADDTERRTLRLKLAHLQVEVGKTDEAVTIYNDMLGARPDDLQAMQELENLQRRLGNWREVRDVLERKLDLLQAGQRVPVLEEMAVLSEEKLDDVDEAIERHRRLLLEAPRHTPSLVALWRLYEGAEKWEDLSQLLEQFLAVLREVGGVDQRREVGLRLAELYSERLGEAEKARELLNELLQTDPNSVPALMALAAVEEQQGNDAAMQELLQRAAALQPQGTVGADLQLRLARLAETPEKQREHLEMALHLHPANIEAARTLLELSRKEGYWEQVAYLLALLASYAAGDEQRKLIIERVDLLVEKVGDIEEALRALAPVYEVVQDDVEINRRIADALFVSGRFEDAGGMYAWLVQVASAQPKKTKLLAHYLTRMARIALASETPDMKAALDKLKDAYKIDTTNAETMVLLTDVYAHQNSWDDSLKLARAMLLQNVDQSGMVRRGDIYLRLANAHLGLKETSKALSMLRRGLEEDPEHPELGNKIREIQAAG
ncbi:tetratricopeptide repeat protein [Nannocystis punicea]|uniref:Tetratricopeptide repeat protein n=1 Tax=Nannocystis punicea TaxID=2995304 RepID=A0ABY7GSL8_9BACT|nr:tetratricopeptide repeat protein [Nannocystis poenicansa]WAS89918.1 tetratricopeptide repeat protein [Nannocystis poenicansa]